MRLSPHHAPGSGAPSILASALALVAPFALGPCDLARSAPPDRPNIILPLADDRGFSDLDGSTVRLEGAPAGATLDARRIDRFKIRIDLDPGDAPGPLAVRVQLPHSGRDAWPIADVEVRDAATGQALPARRPGIEWHSMTIPLPARRASILVQATDPPLAAPAPAPERERSAVDPESGLAFAIATWHDGRRAALSIRFDDSHPSHLDTVIPILDGYGFRGTFMVNPGAREPGSRRRSEFQDRLADWEAVARKGTHELANHSARHRGARGDGEMDAEIGEAARAIWQLTGTRSKLMALNLGGGTTWETTRTLRHYLDAYHQFDASGNSTGMDDTYGNRVETFRKMLAQHIERGLWFRVHYHSIGERLASSEANFRAALDVAREHAADLWIAGMTEIHKYKTARDSARLRIARAERGRIVLGLSCATSPDLYDHPLTIEIAPADTRQPRVLAVRDAAGLPLPLRTGERDGRSIARFDLPPRDAEVSVELGR